MSILDEGLTFVFAGNDSNVGSKSWPHSLLNAGRQMGRLVAEFDWSSTPLGDIRSWPQSLRTAVSLCLLSRFPILVWWGPQLHMVYNDGYRPMLGAKHPRALGAPGREVWTEIWDVIGPMLDSVMAGEGATWSDDQMLLLDRHGFLEECYFTYSYSPIQLETGGIGGVFCVVTETTEKVIGARRLETLGSLAAQLVDSPSLQEVCQRTIKCLAANDRDIRFAEIYLPREDGFARAAGFGGATGQTWPLAEVAKTGQGMAVPEAYVVPVCEPGEVRPCAVLVVGLSAQRPFDADYRSFLDLIGTHVGTAVGGATAFERQRQRAQALAELDAAKTTFFSNLSHELRTPLTLIAGPVRDALEDERQPLPETQRERLLLVSRNAARLRRLVNGMLDFARIEAGRLVPDLVAVDVAQATAELVASFSDVMRRAGLAFVVDVKRLPRKAYVDRDMWDRIVLNLLSNALKYTMEGRVEVTLRGGASQVMLTVSDTGVGIPEADLPRLFDRFHRVAGAKGRSHEGSGIGLAMVSELLKLLGGSITVASELGRGSTFTVRLPYGRKGYGRQPVAGPAQDTADPFVQEAESWANVPAAAKRRTSVPRLLIAEDNNDLRNYLAGLLEEHYDLQLVADGEQAWAAIRAQRPHLMLADVMMPGMDGFALLAEVRADPALRDLPVVLLSARAGEEAAAEGFGAGADDYMVKPFSARDLLTRLDAVLTRATARSRDAAWRTAMIRSLREGVVIANRQGAIIEVNDAFAALSGWPAEAAPFAAPYPWWPDGQELIPGTHRVRFTHRDGHRLWVSVAVTEVEDQLSGEVMLVGTVRDITREYESGQRKDAATRLAAVLAANLSESELYAAACAGFGEVFGGEAVIAEGSFPSETPAFGLTPQAGLGVDVPGDPALRLWIQFPVPRAVAADEGILAALLADILAASLARAARESRRDNTERHLRQAIDSHRNIGQAVGILMERHRLTATEAFERLRQVSRQRNMKLRDVAEQVIETGEDPAAGRDHFG